MKKAGILTGILIAGCFLVVRGLAQDTEPPLELPIGDSSPTATVTVIPTSTPEVVLYTTVTPTSEQVENVVEEAETGGELYLLSGISLLAGLGLYFIKKYFDLKKHIL